MQITSLDFSNFGGRIAIGKVARGVIKAGDPIRLVKNSGGSAQARIKELQVFEGLGRKKVDEVAAGDICAVVGLDDFQIGDTIADFEAPEGLEPILVDEPTMSMLFSVNNSPFFGREGKFVTSRQLRDRLYKETEKNLALRIEETDSADSFLVDRKSVV